MKTNDQFTTQLLEQYVFNVVDLFIESVDPSTQSKLIHLFNQVSTSADDMNTMSRLQTLQRADTEWQQVLQQPVNWGSISSQWLVNVSQQRIKRHEIYIARLKKAVEITQYRLQQVQNSCLAEPVQSGMVICYQRTLADYYQQLARAQTAHQNNLQLVRRLQRSFNR